MKKVTCAVLALLPMLACADAWTGMQQQIETTCVTSRSATAEGQALGGSAVAGICGCLARESVQRMRSSPQFLQAMREQDSDAMAQITRTLQREPDGTHLLQRCAAQAPAPLTVPPPPLSDSTVRGLKGAVRSRFLQETTLSCAVSFATQVNQGRLSQSQLDAYCGCMAKGMADKISEADLKEGSQSRGRTPALDGAARQLQQECSQTQVGG